MMDTVISTLAGLGLGPALLSFLGTWAAVRVEMRWLRADIDRAHRRLDRLELTQHERA